MLLAGICCDSFCGWHVAARLERDAAAKTALLEIEHEFMRALTLSCSALNAMVLTCFWATKQMVRPARLL